MNSRRKAGNRRNRYGWTIAVALHLLLVASSYAGGGPEHFFLVVNPRDPGSLEVANRYVELRKIPPANVFYLPWTPNTNNTGGLIFREKILKPILAEIDKRGLTNQIDGVVYSTGYPWQLDFARMFAGQTLSPQNRPMLSLTGATYLRQFVETSDPRLVSFASNDYFAGAGAPTVTRAFRTGGETRSLGSSLTSDGSKYLLSTALGFTTGSGNTVREITAMIERSVSADGTRPPGAFYYMVNQDVRTTVRKIGFPAAIGELTAAGRRATTLNGVVPAGKTDIAGLTTGSAVVPLATGHARLLPGALVDNLTSAGGQLYTITQPKPQTRISEFLRLGAAGASGTVVEPFALPPKFPAPSLHVHYARGASMAEAFYLSVAAPFQLLIIGDPLCQPWASIPQVSVSGVPASGFASGTIDLIANAASPDGAGISRFDLYVDGVRTLQRRAGENLRLDTTKLDDGYHELRVVAVGAAPIETEGRWIGDVMVRNGHDGVELSMAPGSFGSTVSLGAPLKLSAAATSEGPIVIYHNEREVARAAGGPNGGAASVDTALLGRGRALLQARLEGGASGPTARSRPLEAIVR